MPSLGTIIDIRKDGESSPEIIDLNCSLLDPTKTIELLVNGVIRMTLNVGSIVPAEADSNLYLESWSSPSATISPSVNGIVNYFVGNLSFKSLLGDFGPVTGTVTGNGKITISATDGSGNIIELRYKV